MADAAAVAKAAVKTEETSGAVPTRGKRYRLWKDGDYCIYQISAPDGGLPSGSLVPLPDVPHFEGSKEAMKFVENSGDMFAGKQLFIMRGYEILKVEVQSTPKLTISKKPKIQVAGPETEDSDG